MILAALAFGAMALWFIDGLSKEEEFMVLKKSVRLTRTIEILQPILGGFREAHEKQHPGLSGIVAGISISIERLEIAAAQALAEESEADAAQFARVRAAQATAAQTVAVPTAPTTVGSE